MIDFIVRVGINTAAVVVAVKVVPEISAPEDLVKLLGIGVILGVINTYIRPIVKALAFPISLLTLGLVGLVINAAMLLLAAFVSDQLELGFLIAGWPDGPFALDVVVYAVVAALVISVVSTILAFFLGQKRIFGLRV
ncbi:MAG TPA: phage holin family protein [Candidatus Limnocylindrales bacterium]|nr:phage holin family protein [Candidatus Limnocylindrales bacterium]